MTRLKFQARADDEEDAEGVYLQHQQCYPCEGSDVDYICDEVSYRKIYIIQKDLPDAATRTLLLTGLSYTRNCRWSFNSLV